MRPKIRLDPVVKLQEQREEQRLREMAEAGRLLKTAAELLSESRARAESDERRHACAWDWQLAELSHTRALSDMRAAEHAFQTAHDESSASRDRYAAAHSKAEALRRIAALRVGEIVQARATTEQRERDDLAILRHGLRDPRREAA